ncbi:hypothetical protein TNCV_1475481 [Trichonephila clavipes]|nr:hypothetical protein TNCV_1475481 [Trichonephila clavipes]
MKKSSLRESEGYVNNSPLSKSGVGNLIAVVCHTSMIQCVTRTHIVDEFHEVADIRRMDWPSRSPDHNSIEYAWDGLEEAISHLNCPPRIP